MSSNNAHPSAFVAGIIAAMLFAVSLFLPVATAQQMGRTSVIGGWELLFIGPFGALNGQFGWYATPCLIVAVVGLCRRRPLAGRGWMVLTVATALLLADAWRWTDYPNDAGSRPIVHYDAGYAAWVAAVVVGIIGLLLARFAGRGARG